MSAELHCAWVWDCDECGAENFERAVEGDASEPAMAICDDMVAILQAEESACITTDNGDGTVDINTPELIGAIAMCPRHVLCRSCGQQHEAHVARIDDEKDI
jgi:hypothetical protein